MKLIAICIQHKDFIGENRHHDKRRNCIKIVEFM